MKKQAGFTLIELLLVLAIIGIISAIAIPALLGQRARSRDRAAVANANSIVSDLVASYDKARDAGMIFSTGNFITIACGDSATPLIPQFFTAANPWNSGTLAYNNTLVAEATLIGTTTITAATAGPLGQVYVGFLPPPDNGDGCLASAVLLNAAFKDASGTTTSTYSYVTGVD
jgi:type IV pilus assembly protein PilA